MAEREGYSATHKFQRNFARPQLAIALSAIRLRFSIPSRTQSSLRASLRQKQGIVTTGFLLPQKKLKLFLPPSPAALTAALAAYAAPLSALWQRSGRLRIPPIITQRYRKVPGLCFRSGTFLYLAGQTGCHQELLLQFFHLFSSNHTDLLIS